jgi:hypothetical protein
MDGGLMVQDSLQYACPCLMTPSEQPAKPIREGCANPVIDLCMHVILDLLRLRFHVFFCGISDMKCHVIGRLRVC